FLYASRHRSSLYHGQMPWSSKPVTYRDRFAARVSCELSETSATLPGAARRLVVSWIGWPRDALLHESFHTLALFRRNGIDVQRPFPGEIGLQFRLFLFGRSGRTASLCWQKPDRDSKADCQQPETSR